MRNQIMCVALASLSLIGCWVDDTPPRYGENGYKEETPSEDQWEKPNKYQDRDHAGNRGDRGASR